MKPSVSEVSAAPPISSKLLDLGNGNKSTPWSRNNSRTGRIVASGRTKKLNTR